MDQAGSDPARRPDAARLKILTRLRNLLARAESTARGGEHEAKLARERADELIAKHSVTPDEIAATLAEPATKRCAGPLVHCFIGQRASWGYCDLRSENLAFLVAQRFQCKAFEARRQLFFEGVRSVDAAVFYKKFARKLEYVVGMRPQTFVIRPGLVAYSDCRPAQYATLFCDGEKLPFRGDLGSLSNDLRQYTWVFEDRGLVAPGAHLVFAAWEFEIVGLVTDNRVRIVAESARVAKTTYGEPMHVEEQRWMKQA